MWYNLDMKFLRRIGLVIIGILMAFSSTNSVFAKLPEEKLRMFAENGIYYYDPSESLSCYGGGSIGLSGDTVMARIVDYLTGNNPTNFTLSGNGVAGILANFQAESGFNPFRFQGDRVSGPAYGVAQFDPMSKITDKLKSDSRTSNFFNEYFDLKYSSTNFETGFPNEPVPDDVLNAWLLVQLDYFFGPSSEFENTKVGSYRNLGGSMGLDYIEDGMNVHQAMDAAQSPEDAAKIFVWIMERPADKPGGASRRGELAREWYNKISNDVSASDATGVLTTDGSNVTIIGDSITEGSKEAILALMPNADIHSQISKQFYTGTGDNPGGYTIMKQLADEGSLRDVVIFALGTNGNITSGQAEDVVSLAGISRKVVFVTNYSTKKDYTSNNNIFAKMSNDNTNVDVVDWKGAVESHESQYLSPNDGVHPTAEGRELFASLIASAGASVASEIPECGIGSVDGGLTEPQTIAVQLYYNEIGGANYVAGLPGGINNCVSFSTFFVRKFTTLGMSAYSRGNGGDIAANFAADYGLPSGDEPRPFAVFSITSNYVQCGNGGCGHTGVVVNVNGDDVTTLEANYGETGGAKIVHRDKSYFTSRANGDPFTYLDSILDESALKSAIEEGSR